MFNDGAPYTDRELLSHKDAQIGFIRRLALPILGLILITLIYQLLARLSMDQFWLNVINANYDPFRSSLVTKSARDGLPAYVIDRVEDYVGYLRRGRQVEAININISFEDWTDIRARRDMALKAGRLGEQQYHKVTIDWRGEKLRAKIRLKGIGSDHRDHEDKWSFAVALRGDDFLLGMDRFSIHHPKTRAFQAECLYSDLLHDYELLGSRCMFIDVSINGSSIGVMTLTERLGVNLLEMQGRKEGNLFGLTYEDMWEDLGRAARYAHRIADGKSKDEFQIHTSAHALNRLLTPLQVYNSNALQEDAALASQYASAIGLWRGMLDGALQPSEVFEVKSAASVIALTFLMGDFHALQVHNIKFYFNPIIQKFELLPTDVAMVGHPSGGGKLPAQSTYLLSVLRILASDVEIYRELLRQLRIFGAQLNEEDSPFGVSFGERDSAYLDALRPEFPLLPPANPDWLRFRLDKFFDDLQQATFFTLMPSLTTTSLFNSHPKYDLGNSVFASFHGTSTGLNLHVTNRYSTPLKILSYRLSYTDLDGVPREASASVNMDLPATLHGITERGSRVAGEIEIPIPVEHKEAHVDRLAVSVALTNGASQHIIEASYYPEKKSSHPLSPNDLAQILRQYPFFRVDSDNKTLVVPEGNWSITEFLKFPAGYRLVIKSGAEIVFSADAGIILRGPLLIQGEPQKKVLLAGRGNERWRGITVLHANQWGLEGGSEVEHATISGTTNSNFDSWSVTGGLTFYKSDVSLSDTTIENTIAEDALNIVHSNFSLSDVTIRDTLSDAFDGDFSKGRIEESTFTRIGGDAIDFSGSVVEVTNSRFITIADKAVSVGEQSYLTGDVLEIIGAATGIVSKDGSSTEINGVTFTETKYYDAMAYVKKPQYGSADLIIENTASVRPLEAVAQKKSSLVLNGEAIRATKLDVDALYDGYMAK